METLSRETLNHSDKSMLEKILVKSPSEMTSEEVGVVRARRAYLTAIEKATFKEILEGEVIEEDGVDGEVAEKKVKKSKKK